MSSRLELTPAELDRLEDALEELEFSSLPEGPQDDPVVARLADFQGLLQLSREALPMEEVPAGLLDDVLAEARQAAATTTSERKPLWSRWRIGVWLPTLAFAGSAAALLLVLIPGSDDAPTVAATAEQEAAVKRDAPSKPEPQRELRLAQAQTEQPDPADEFAPADGQRARGEGLAAGDTPTTPGVGAQEPVEAEPPADVRADEEAPLRRKQSKSNAAESSSPARSSGAKPKPAPRPNKKPSTSTAKTDSVLGSGSGAKSKGKGMGGAPPPASEPAKDEDKEASPDLWPQVLEGDALRRGDNCGLATMRYANARKSEIAKVRARALAGEGLCAYMAGKTGKATKLFKQARAASPGVDAFIDQELSRIDAALGNDAVMEADEAQAPQTKE